MRKRLDASKSVSKRGWVAPAAIALTSASLIGSLSGCTQQRTDEQANTALGTLVVTANGEDFVREGFTTKDGWQIDFEHVYVTLDRIEAFQSDPPFDPSKQARPTASQSIRIAEAPITVDLAAGGDDARPVVKTVDMAYSGRYNALAWQMVPPAEGPSAGYPLMLVGRATKGSEVINFQLQMEEKLAFVCGDFIGDERKGFLSEGETAELEATFHFDHLFGDGSAPADDEINTGALGFEPIAVLAKERSENTAEDGRVLLTSRDLQQNFSKEDYETLQTILPSLGHVGEGHCRETQLS